MTLRDFFELVSNNPSILVFFFIAVPLTAFLAYIFGKGEAGVSPWSYLYSTLVYLTCIPGIFAFVLNIYLLFIEKQSIMDFNMYTQILPIVSMLFTLWLIKRNTNFDDIPGFDKISGLLWVLLAIISLLWICEKTHIFVISFMPFHYFILFFVGVLLLIRFGVKRIFA
jgi:multisubunit Na+/H+ antiporter MnhF subunit